MSAQMYLKLYQRYPIMRAHLQGISKSSVKYNLGMKLSKQNLIPEANSFVTLRGLGAGGKRRQKITAKMNKKVLCGEVKRLPSKSLESQILKRICGVDLNVIDIFTFESQFLLKFMSSVKCLSFK